MKRVLPLCALLFALGALPTSAILDTNSNGLSDLWERAYNGGDLFSSINPLADDDGDGWTNEQEAAAGTSPFDANAPDGIVRPQTNHIPEVLGVSPEVIQVTWPQIPGKVYTLLFSPDLIDWLPVGEAFIGSEIEQVYIFPLTQIEGQPPPPDKLFWRVKVEDVDSDADGLTDAEEHELGTDPDNSETLAGYPDMWLAENYLPDLLNDELSSLDLNGDPDLDGLTNAQEKKLGTNPAVSDNPGIVQDSISNGEFSHPLIGSGKRSEVTDPDWDYWEGLPADEYGKTSWTAVVGTNIEYQIGTPKEGCDQYVELKAHPGYNYGIKQQVGTRIGVTYLLVFDCRTRPGTDAANNNFSVVIDNGEPKPITFAEHTGWISKAISFKATDVITHISLVPDNNQNDTMGCFVDNVKLVPVEVAVDADRNGQIEFGKDTTTAEKPFRFWINNDQDDVEADEPILVENPDSFDNEIIQTKRDLEDFCRLKLHVGLSNQTLRDGDFQIGLMFRGSSGATPGIRIWKNQSNDGNLDYLKDHTAATAQIALGAFEKFPPLQVTLIPKDYWAGRNDSTAHLIFEGTSKGKGELVVTIHDKHGAKLGEGSGIWMDLLDVREMYQRARVANEAEQIPSPATNPTPPAQTWNWDPWNWPYSEDPQATEKTAVFVHGWRLKYMDYMNWSDTSYKRLWHQGFKGKFYSFRWATFSGDNNGLPYGFDENIEGTAFPPGGTTYNASEYRAWLCGPTLAAFVNQLPNAGNRSLFAHSMGNVTAGAALRSGMSIQRYAMCNAAMAAMAYDPDPILRNVDNIFIPGTLPELRDTPDTDPDPAIRTGYGLENKFNLPGNPTVFNFGLPDDTALGSWSANNLYFKPNPQYLYTENSILQPFPLAYQATLVSSYRSVTAVPEAMGYVTKSRTRAAGADLRTNGKIAPGNKIDMKDWFNDTHSAQWRWSNHSTELFWKELSIRLILKEENP